MKQKLSLRFILSLVVLLGSVPMSYAALPNPLTLDFPTSVHFLNPAGEDVVVPAGIYQVEAAESWLKLIPKGQARSAAILVEASPGTHDQSLTEPVVRAEVDRENPDVFHLAMLQPDGNGLEAIGTKSGIRSRAAQFFFLARPAPRNQPFTPHSRVQKKKSQVVGARPNVSLPRPVGQAELSLSPKPCDSEKIEKVKVKEMRKILIVS